MSSIFHFPLYFQSLHSIKLSFVEAFWYLLDPKRLVAKSVLPFPNKTIASEAQANRWERLSLVSLMYCCLVWVCSFKCHLALNIISAQSEEKNGC